MIELVIFAIAFLTIILIALIIIIVRQRNKYSTLRSMYMNGDAEVGEPSSYSEWKRLAEASLAASHSRRRNGGS